MGRLHVGSTHFGHANTGIDNGQGMVRLVGYEFDEQFLAGVELRRVGEGFVADLVQCIRGVRDHFAKEDLLVGIERVDDQRHELGDFGLEGECFAVA